MHGNVGVVYVNYRSTELIARSLATLPASAGLKIAVVDNSGDYASGHPAVDVVRTGANLGYGAGVNRGVEALRAKGCDVFVLLNPDCFLFPGALEQLVGEQERAGGIVSGIVLEADAAERPADTVWFAGGSISRFGHIRNVGYGEPLSNWAVPGELRETRWISGCLMAFDGRTWDVVGPWEEGFFLYLEDVEWCLRGSVVKRHVLMEPLGWHIGGSTSGGRLSPRWRRQLRANYRVLARRHSPWFLVEMLRETCVRPLLRGLRNMLTARGGSR